VPVCADIGKHRSILAGARCAGIAAKYSHVG
jgi:hypothetical protein